MFLCISALVCMCMCRHAEAHVPQHACVGGDQRILGGVSSLLPPLCGLPGLNSGHQACVANAFTHWAITMVHLTCFLLFYLSVSRWMVIKYNNNNKLPYSFGQYFLNIFNSLLPMICLWDLGHIDIKHRYAKHTFTSNNHNEMFKTILQNAHNFTIY